MTEAGTSGERRGRSPLVLAILTAIGVALIAAFVSLGVWQLQRRLWKLDLIAKVDARLHAPAVIAPPFADPEDVYRRVTATGVFRNDRESFVQAVTERGPGYWVLTPLVTPRFTILVNRGFVSPDRRGKVAPPRDTVSVRGLLRMTEPGGGFLRSNVPAEDRWYSRDVAAIAARRGLTDVAPYFIDAVADPKVEWPRGGLTVVTFRNNHLVYALTWFGLALLLGGMTWWVARREPGA